MMEEDKNLLALTSELDWFMKFLDERFRTYFDVEAIANELTAPELDSDSAYGSYILENELGPNERIVLFLVLGSVLKPQVLDIFFTKNTNFDRPFTEFGGQNNNNNGRFIPTVETADFLLNGSGVSGRLKTMSLFDEESKLMSSQALTIENNDGDPSSTIFERTLTLNPIYTSYFLTGQKALPESLDVFPAKKINTEMEWSDLVLDAGVKSEIEQLCTWVKQSHKINSLQAVKKYIKPGLRSLFYGPPGTGKTMTATLIGKETGRDVYRIDLSMIVSKYIGETEKNLSKVFDYAISRNWILFFDEADALFGKRTQTNSSNDRYANQEVAYLLQRIEDFPGVVILASNLKSNIDEAFSRRFQSMIYFPVPDKDLRLKLWENMFAGEILIEERNALEELSNSYDLSGGSAINVFRHGLLKAMGRDSLTITKTDLLEGIRKEFQKYGRTL